MTDDSLTIEPGIIAEGPIEFDIDNNGERQHSVIIIKTNLEADALPKEDDGRADEGAADVDVQHEVEEIDDGDSTSRTYDLDPGNYVIISNEVHEEDGTEIADYSEGMYDSLIVASEE